MIAYLSGILRHADPQSVILDVSGVGYQVGITTQTQSLLGPIGSALTLHIVTQVREDAITLFGFSARDEKDSFLKLTTVQGVGARMALNLLSSMSSEQLWRAILSDDKKSLTAAEGVGPKLAARLTTELKDYAGKQVFPGTGSLPKTARNAAPISAVPQIGDITREAVSALINLGYAPTDAARAVSIIANENNEADLSTIIRLSLQEVSHA
ncbi:MAG: ruvA [Alphaproteobacteria bacterium]|nr:ruvA [Alphaproteobacteria bacterium]